MDAYEDRRVSIGNLALRKRKVNQLKIEKPVVDAFTHASDVAMVILEYIADLGQQKDLPEFSDCLSAIMTAIDRHAFSVGLGRGETLQQEIELLQAGVNEDGLGIGIDRSGNLYQVQHYADSMKAPTFALVATRDGEESFRYEDGLGNLVAIAGGFDMLSVFTDMLDEVCQDVTNLVIALEHSVSEEEASLESREGQDDAREIPEDDIDGQGVSAKAPADIPPGCGSTTREDAPQEPATGDNEQEATDGYGDGYGDEVPQEGPVDDGRQEAPLKSLDGALTGSGPEARTDDGSDQDDVRSDPKDNLCETTVPGDMASPPDDTGSEGDARQEDVQTDTIKGDGFSEGAQATQDDFNPVPTKGPVPDTPPENQTRESGALEEGAQPVSKQDFEDDDRIMVLSKAYRDGHMPEDLSTFIQERESSGVPVPDTIRDLARGAAPVDMVGMAYGILSAGGQPREPAGEPLAGRFGQTGPINLTTPRTNSKEEMDRFYEQAAGRNRTPPRNMTHSVLSIERRSDGATVIIPGTAVTQQGMGPLEIWVEWPEPSSPYVSYIIPNSSKDVSIDRIRATEAEMKDGSPGVKQLRVTFRKPDYMITLMSLDGTDKSECRADALVEYYARELARKGPGGRN